MSKRKSIAEQLRKIIQDDPENVYQIAKRTGIAQSVLWRFLNGERDLTLATADKLFLRYQLRIVRE